MSADHFSLCWNNFHNNLSSGFSSLLESEHLVDVTLAAEGRYLKAHKIVLSVCSQYFKELFCVNPCKHPIVILKDVSYSALKDLLQFMYQGEVSVSQDDLNTFMKVAETLQIKGLTEDSVNSSQSNQNGLKIPNTQISGSTQLTPQKRQKPYKRLLPNKIPKIIGFDNDQLQRQSETEPIDVVLSKDDSKLSLEPEVLVNEESINLKLTPKEAPYDDDISEHSLEIDMSSMVDTSMGESSSIGEHSSQSQHITWHSDSKGYISDNQNSPGGLRFVQTPKGRTVVIHSNHMYTMHERRSTKTTWVCVMQRKLNCPGCVTTSNSPDQMLLSYSGHNHSQLNDIISRLDCNIAQENKTKSPFLE